MLRPKILCIADVVGWAFDRNARDMAAALAGEFDFKRWYMTAGHPPADLLARHDAIYCAYRWDLDMPDEAWAKAVGSLRCEFFDTEYPAPPTQADVDEVNRFGMGFHTVTRGAYEELRLRCPRVSYLTNPVDVARLGEPTTVSDRVVASWSGHARHPHPKGLDVKGFETVILPAVRLAGVQFVYAERVTRPVSQARMPDFYRLGNVTLCASLWEGASNSVMEAMAMGHAVIATDCGNHREMQASQLAHLGASGIEIVPRSPEAFAEALTALTPDRVLEMGALNRQEIAERWSWAAWKNRYADLLRGANRPPRP